MLPALITPISGGIFTTFAGLTQSEMGRRVVGVEFTQEQNDRFTVRISPIWVRRVGIYYGFDGNRSGDDVRTSQSVFQTVVPF